jgi:hypothetical protein
MSVLAEPLLVALKVARALEGARIPYLVGGSVATLLLGEPRATLDVDFAVHMSADQAIRLAQALEAEFFVQREALIEAARLRDLCNVIHRRPMLKVDLHVREPRGHSAAEMSRALSMQVGPSAEDRLRVATPEDAILSKLRWYRGGGAASDRQWRDVLGVMKVHRTSLDQAYLARWGIELGLKDLLERARCESELP